MRSISRALSLVAAYAALSGVAAALPILPGNEHPHGPTTPSDWFRPFDEPDPTKLHWHYTSDDALGFNLGEPRYYAHKAWDDNGATTTFHFTSLSNPPTAGSVFHFGHGFIASAVDYWFNPLFPAPSARHRLIVDAAFRQWEVDVRDYWEATHPAGTELGFDFRRQGAKPAAPFVDIRFLDLADGEPRAPSQGGIDADFGTDDTFLGYFSYDVALDQYILALGRSTKWFTGLPADEIGADQYDLQTVALHEIGHALGLGHVSALTIAEGGDPLMRAVLAPGVQTNIDIGARRGAAVIYTQTQSVPEPGFASLALTACLFLACRRLASLL